MPLLGGCMLKFLQRKDHSELNLILLEIQFLSEESIKIRKKQAEIDEKLYNINLKIKRYLDGHT